MKMYLVQTYYGSDFYNYMALYNEAADMWLIETGFGGGAIQEVEAFTFIWSNDQLIQKRKK